MSPSLNDKEGSLAKALKEWCHGTDKLAADKPTQGFSLRLRLRLRLAANFLIKLENLSVLSAYRAGDFTLPFGQDGAVLKKIPGYRRFFFKTE